MILSSKETVKDKEITFVVQDSVHATKAAWTFHSVEIKPAG